MVADKPEADGGQSLPSELQVLGAAPGPPSHSARPPDRNRLSHGGPMADTQTFVNVSPAFASTVQGTGSRMAVKRTPGRYGNCARPHMTFQSTLMF